MLPNSQKCQHSPQLTNIKPAQHRSELLMPAGSLVKLKTAILYGADAVYLGTPDLSLRTKSDFTLEEVIEGVKFAHQHQKRVYLTLNLFSHNKDIDKLPQYVETVRKVKPDGLIVADPGVFMFVKDMAPELKLHVSTQANVCSWQSVKFWQKLGADLCVLGREVSYAELKEIRQKCPDIKLEAFVHGSMCMTYSGRCLLSNFMAERGANQGACANSCRWRYKVHIKLKDGTVKDLNLTDETLDLFEFFLEEEHRGGELLPFEEDDRGAYILNSRDLNVMPRLNDLLAIGVDSLKVEGRGKSPYYVAIVAKAYRMAIDSYYRDPENWHPSGYLDELASVPNRGYTLGFHDGRLTNYAHTYDDGENLADYELAGYVKDVTEDGFVIDVKNKIVAGDVLEFISPTRPEPMLIRLYEFHDFLTGEIKKIVQPGQKPTIKLPFQAFDREDTQQVKNDFPPLTVIRKQRALTEAQWKRLQLDQQTSRMEAGTGNPDLVKAKRDTFIKARQDNQKYRAPKTPRLGEKGCCGKGCNGCLIFWHDPLYAKARQILAQKKLGQMLPSQRYADLVTKSG